VADFTKAVDLTLANEGGYVNDPRDAGGETNFGISKRSYPNVDIKNLTRAGAIAIYQRDFWNPLYASITNQFVANTLFDSGVLFGVHADVRVLQGVLMVVTDGLFGPKSLAATNAHEPVALLMHFKNALFAYAVSIVNRNPGDSVFLAGWTNRIQVVAAVVPVVPVVTCP
jgi:lysozyme family protein